MLQRSQCLIAVELFYNHFDPLNYPELGFPSHTLHLHLVHEKQLKLYCILHILAAEL